MAIGYITTTQCSSLTYTKETEHSVFIYRESNYKFYQWHVTAAQRLAVSAGNKKRHDDVIKWKHFPRYWPFVWGIHRSPVNSPHKSQWRGVLMLTSICARINGWVNNCEAGDLRRNHAHYDVIVRALLDVVVDFITLVWTPGLPPAAPSLISDKPALALIALLHVLVVCTDINIL